MSITFSEMASNEDLRSITKPVNILLHMHRWNWGLNE